LENGVLEFPTVFRSFMALMQELEVELEPVKIGSAMFLKNGSHFLSNEMIQKNLTGFKKWMEHLRLDSLYANSIRLWLRTKSAKQQDLYNQPLSAYLKRPCIRNTWLKLLVMYSYSMPLEMIDDFPAELALPVLRDDVAVNWVRIKGGVYTYIEKILARFKGEVVLNADVEYILRSSNTVKIKRSLSETQEFDKVVFATPPDQVMALLADPNNDEIRRFSAWRANYATTLLHKESAIYDRYGIKQPSEFDFFETDSRWGYNSCLNQLCDIKSPQNYFLSLHHKVAPVPSFGR